MVEAIKQGSAVYAEPLEQLYHLVVTAEDIKSVYLSFGIETNGFVMRYSVAHIVYVVEFGEYIKVVYVLCRSGARFIRKSPDQHAPKSYIRAWKTYISKHQIPLQQEVWRGCKRHAA